MLTRHLQRLRPHARPIALPSYRDRPLCTWAACKARAVSASLKEERVGGDGGIRLVLAAQPVADTRARQKVGEVVERNGLDTDLVLDLEGVPAILGKCGARPVVL